MQDKYEITMPDFNRWAQVILDRVSIELTPYQAELIAVELHQVFTKGYILGRRLEEDKHERTK